ncbi:MAG: MlaD family protein [Solirubrobacteraceae bacterium]
MSDSPQDADEVQEHLTGRVNRARIALELRRASGPAVVVALGLAIGLLLAAYVIVNVSRTIGRDTETLRFTVADATGVVAGANPVRVKGIAAGTITKVDGGGQEPVLTVSLQSKYAPIYRDARAELRPNTALQDMYLDIVDRGTPAAGVATAETPIASSRTSTPVNVADALSTFDGDTRVRLRTTLDQLGNGLHGRDEALRRAFVEIAPFLHAGGGIAEQLARRSSATRRLVHNAAVLTTELRRRDAALRRLVVDGGSVLRELQAGSPDLAATLDEVPATLAAVSPTFVDVERTLPAVDRALRALSPVVASLPEGLSAARRLAADARPAVRALRAPVRRLAPVAKDLSPLSSSLSAALSTLRPQAPTFDHVVGTLADCRRALQTFFLWDPSFLKYGDRYGTAPRGNVVVDPAASGVLHGPNQQYPKSCAPGAPIGGRPATEQDKR